MNKIINEYIKEGNYNNANANYSISGLKAEIAHKILKKDLLFKSPAGKYHKSGDLYLHDLSGGEYSSYCAGHDLQLLLLNGIKNPSGGSSEPAKHLDVVVDHIVNYIYISQNEFEGAQAFSNFDTYLAPFIKNDNLDYNNVKQSLQRMVFNLSYPLRAAFQTPFSNLSLDLKPPEHIKNEPAIIGGEAQEFTYNECQKEMDMINLALLDVMIEGDRDGNPHTFPILTYSITKDFDWNSEVSNRIFELTAKFGTPYFSNYLGSELDPKDSRSMCCRLRLDISEVMEQQKAGGLWNTGISTGSTAVVSINMSRIGYLCTGNEECYFKRLNNLLEVAKQHLEYKREKINKGFELGLMPFTREYLKDFSSHFSTIGILGMNESCLNMFGKPIYECQDFVEKVLKHIKQKTKEFAKETGHLYNFEQTPCFSSSTKFIIKNKRRNLITISNIVDLKKHNLNETEILTPNGFKKIIRFIEKPYNNHLIHIILINGSSMNVTPDHPCVIKDKNKYIIKKCQDLKIGDEMAFNKNILNISNIGNYNLGRACGLWLAEGHHSTTNGTSFTFHKNEIEYINFIKEYAENEFGCNTTIRKHGENGIRIEVFGNGFKNTLLQFVAGEHSWKKHIKSKVFNMSNEFRYGLIDGIWEGDGDKKNNTLTTTSLQLAKDCCKVMNTLNIKYTFRKKDSPSVKKSLKDGNHHQPYMITKITEENHSNTYTRYYKESDINNDRFYYLPIKSITIPTTKTKYVYDVEVDDNEHLLTLANGIISHNCESASYSIAKIDKEKYPDIITQGEGSGIFYTNSSHNYVGDELSLGKSLRCQERFNQYYTGGTLFHIWAGESSPSPEGVKDLIRNICLNTSLPYIAFTKAYSICPNCGISDDLSGICPKCNGITNVYDRVTGYYRPVTKFNKGKQAEFIRRKRFNLKDTFKK